MSNKLPTKNSKPRVVKKIQTIIYDPEDSRKIAVIHEQKFEKNLSGNKKTTRVIHKSSKSFKNLEKFINSQSELLDF